MPDNTAAERTVSRNHDISGLAPKSSPPADEQGLTSAGEDDLEYESPTFRGRSLSQTPHAGNRSSKTFEKSPEDEALSSWQGDSPSSICLCQPDPKVPRPRNAFILYRQHNQAAVVQQNPGLANPEISKIIGDHWRNLSPEEKNHWKLLADEEKIRHQKQYPDYRYQPRRSGRNGNSITTGSQPSSTETSPRKCPKCGGRNIATSSMMSSSVNFGQIAPTSAPLSPGHKVTGTPNSGRFLQRLNLNSPSVSNPPLGHRSRPSTAGVAPPRLVSPPYSRRQDDRETSPRFKRPNNGQPFLRSPDSKRRRITPSNYAPVRVATGPATPFPFTAEGHSRRHSLPRPDFMGPGITTPITMGPPPRPNNMQHQPSAPLTLAPIQSAHPDKMEIDTQEKSLEAMIQSIPTLGKIRVLSKISPPLSPPGPTSPVRQTRGLVIAVEASDAASIKQLTHTLCTNLSDFSPRVFATPAPPDTPPSFQAYLRLIDQYHTLSQQVVDYITTAPPCPSNPLPLQEESSPSPVSPKSIPKPLTTANKDEHVPGGVMGMPVAIIPGFQVTWSDWFASRVGIQDAYSPMDHWQWGATLWRNVVGADVTIAVQVPSSLESETPQNKATAVVKGEKGDGVGRKVSAEGRGGGVEVRLDDSRAVVVKGAEGGGVPEGGLRRVGFEIGEWVRGWEERGKERKLST